MKLFNLLILAILTTFAIHAQEICDNGIDDDNDGFIDFNDDDCFCDNALVVGAPTSLIPNPSFEDYNCLPTSISQMNCADTWVQSSYPTPDFYNVNSFVFYDAPLPPPDGDGFVGFFNIDGWQEYIGATILSPLIANTSYTINFDLGIPDQNSNTDDTITLVIYAHPDANVLPFGATSGYGYNYVTDCPANYPDWDILGSVFLTGDDIWIDSSITFTPAINYNSIVLGGACGVGSNYYGGGSGNGYFFLDNLIVNTTASFQDLVIDSTYVDCNTYNLSIENTDNFNLQWYKDGIALVGETGNLLNLADNLDGEYALIFSNATGCATSDSLILNTLDNPEISILEGNYLHVESGSNVELNAITNANNYALEWQNANNFSCNDCDDPNFIALEESTYTVEITDLSSLCKSDTSIKITVFQAEIVPECVIYVPNVFSPNEDGLNDKFEVFFPNCVEEVIEFSVFNRFGERVNAGSNFSLVANSMTWDGTFNDQKLNTGVFTYFIKIRAITGNIEYRKGNVSLLR